VRQEHRIGKWNVDDPVTAQFLGDLIKNPIGNQYAYFDPEGSVTHNAHINPGVPLATARAANIIAPEVIDGFGDWIRYGSFVSRDLKEVHKTTGEVRTVCRPDASMFDGSNRFYFYFSQSDGTFGPAGTVFITTFANANQGWPLAYLPSPGTDTDGTPLTHTKTWPYHEYIIGPTCGVRGSMWAPYGMASACGQGRLVCGAAGWGLSEFIQTTKPAPDFAKLTRGLQYFMGHDYHLVWGSSGHDSKIPFPFGEDADLDDWADHHGIPRA
jgi:hypothetical protein